VKVWSRRGADFTERFPRIADAVRGLACDEALIDGEAVVFLGDGWSDFHALLTKRGGEAAALVAFDLLRLNGDDLLPASLLADPFCGDTQHRPESESADEFSVTG
jgi:bifunctional non-homologous end joining protein LigD